MKISVTGMLVVARLAISSVTEIAGLLNKTIFTFDPEKKHPVSGSSALLMKEISGEWLEWFEITESLQ